MTRKETDAGLKISDTCREHGISCATHHNWKTNYAGMTTPDPKRMKEMEAELALVGRRRGI